MNGRHHYVQKHQNALQLRPANVTDEEIRAAALQFVRKVSGFTKPSKTNEAAFLFSVDEITRISTHLLQSLETNAPPKNRAEEIARARARAEKRRPHQHELRGLAQPPANATPLRRRLGLEGRFAVGWVGSFRPFHALEQVVEATSTVSGATLLVVGDGPGRAGGSEAGPCP